MPSKFGGIPVDSAPASGSRFGGVPVEDDALAQANEAPITDMPRMEVAPDPTDGMSTGQRVAAGYGGSFVDLYRGAKQFATERLAEPMNAIGSVYGLLGLSGQRKGATDAVNRSLASQQADIDEAAKMDAPLKATPGGMAGNVLGGITQLVGPGVLLRNTAARGAFLPTTTRGNAIQGAVYGGLQPVETGGSRARNVVVSGGVGGAASAVPKLVGKGLSALGRLAPAVTQGGQNRAAASVLERFAESPAALRAGANAPVTLVPGSAPTLAEASGDVGLAGLQRTLANTPDFGNALAQRGKANNLARVNAIQGAFGGADDGAAATVREARDRAASTVLRPIAKTPLGQGQKELTPADFSAYAQQQQRAYIATERAKLQGIAAGQVPAEQAALPPSQRMGADEATQQLGRLDQMEAAIPAQFSPASEAIQLGFPAWKASQAASGPVARGDLGKVVGGVNALAAKHQASPAVRTAMDAVKAELPNIRTVGDAHAVRQYIGQLISGQVEGKAGAKLAKRELMTVQALLDREMRAAYPQWGTFLRDYKAASREADRIDVGAELLATGRTVRASTNDPVLTPSAFGRAAGDMDRTVKRATGFNRATADRTLTQEQREVVESVRMDLERYSRAASDGKALGSNTMQNAVGGNSLQGAVGPVGAAMIEPTSGIVLLAVNQMRKAYGQKVAVLVEEAMLDPARAAQILAAVPAGQRAEVVRAIARYIPRVSGSVAPALTE